ncbi:hypothetical protein [Entoleuca gammaflexivirus 2]|uniref:Uncharacterized protein n=1 Tax=Entoleuca gammaflexivirus 2 TaxID=2086642 RepID=A0AAE6HYN0_9VIRU|nr:hypothetical protein QKQ70_gp3 [Pistacia-associated flexivirus 1]QDO72747.1 hypothetical protein [Entoleuca gammaflexivirus 2]
MAELSFPVVCTQGHEARSLTSPEELATHHASAHPNVSINDYRNSLRSSGRGSDRINAPPPPPVFNNPLHAWGLNVSNFTAYSSDDVSSGSELSVRLLQEFFDAYGRSFSPPMPIDTAALLLDFFLYCLFNAATNDASPTGSFVLRESDGPRQQKIRWTAFFAAAQDHFDPAGYAFTPRRMMRTCEPAFWELWQNSEVKALDRVRSEGTPISRQWRLPNGKHPPAYALVPQLFTSHLTNDERACRKSHQATITKLSTAAARPEYEGLDPENTVVASDVERQALEHRSLDLQNKTAGLRNRGGLGSGNAPRADPVLEAMYDSRHGQGR